MKKVLFSIIIILSAFSAIAQQTVVPGSNNNASFYNANINGETQTVSASSSSSSIVFSLSVSINYPDVTVSNAGSSTAFVICGIGTQTALLPGAGNKTFPILAGETMTLRKGVGSDTCAAITASSTTTVYFTAEEGN